VHILGHLLFQICTFYSHFCIKLQPECSGMTLFYSLYSGLETETFCPVLAVGCKLLNIVSFSSVSEVRGDCVHFSTQ
jgi:hypothetical protein